MIKMTPKILGWLRVLEEGPTFLPSREPAFLQDLWLEDYINIIGKSIYITDKGLAAVQEKTP